MRHRTLLAIAAALSVSGYSSAAVTNWTGTNGTDWADDGNWDNLSPDANGDAVFSGVIANQPALGTGDTIRSLYVNSGDWTFSSDDGAGNNGLLRLDIDAGSPAYDMSISGGGMTRINANLGFAQNYTAADIFIDTGTTLVVNGNVAKPGNRDLKILGNGKLVVNGTIDNAYAVPTGAGNSGSYLFNGANAVTMNGPVIGDAESIGGLAPTFRIYQYTALTIDAGGTLSPGGDGSTLAVDGYDGGELISTLTVQSTSTTIRAGVTFNASARLQMDIGNALGDNDQIVIGFLTDDFRLNGAELALRNTGGFVDGTYTLITETLAGSDYTGTFGSVTLNGSPLDPANYTLNYEPTEVSITLVPEPTSLAMLVGLAIPLIQRRRA